MNEEELYELLEIYRKAYKDMMSVCDDIICNSQILPIKMLATVKKANEVKKKYGNDIRYMFELCKKKGKPYEPMRTIN